MRGRRKGRTIYTRTSRQGSQDSTEEPKEKETRLSDHSHSYKLYNRDCEVVSFESRPSLPDYPAPVLTDIHAMDTAMNDCPSRDGCDSPTMPLLSPEVPSFGELPCIGKDGPPVLSQYGVDDVCDQASDKSEGDSGKENEEDSTIKWRGSRSSLTSRASRSSRPRSGPFNQLNNTNIKVVKPEKKSVLGEANNHGPVTRSSLSTKPASIPNLEALGSHSRLEAGLDNAGQPTKAGTGSKPSANSRTSPEKLDITLRPLESPKKTQALSVPQSPMSPHKIQIPDRPSLTDKLKLAISNSPKTFSTKNAKRSAVRKTEGTKATKKLGKLAQAAEGSRQITDFFPIRRSERKKKSEIEKGKMEDIEARLLATDDTDLDLEIREMPTKGRGIVTKRDFSKGDFVLEYSGELIDIGSAKDRESMYSLDTTKGCYMYYFNHKDKQYCIDATQESGRFGRLVNHSCKTPNCVTKVVMLGEEPRLILVAKQDIEENTELLYDYGDRSKESLKAHPWLAL